MLDLDYHINGLHATPGVFNPLTRINVSCHIRNHNFPQLYSTLNVVLSFIILEAHLLIHNSLIFNLRQPLRMDSPKPAETSVHSQRPSLVSITSKVVEVFIDTDDEEVEIIEQLPPIPMREHPVQDIE